VNDECFAYIWGHKFNRIEMKRFLLFIVCFFSIAAQARNVKEAFLSMPVDMLQEVSEESRTELIESYEANSDTAISVLNKLDENLFIETLTETYFRLNMGNTDIQIIVLPTDHSRLYCFIRTTCAPACDSRIEFYSANWEKLNASNYITVVPPSSFFDNYEDSSLSQNISLMQFDYNEESNRLIQTNNSSQISDSNDRGKAKATVRNEKTEYYWDNRKFVQE
jgi:hypothetical protein